jgi:hypothetical protein
LLKAPAAVVEGVKNGGLVVEFEGEFGCKFVEVKSENDRLGDKQVFWIRFLVSCGFEVEMLKIKPKPAPPSTAAKKAPKRTPKASANKKPKVVVVVEDEDDVFESE